MLLHKHAYADVSAADTDIFVGSDWGLKATKTIKTWNHFSEVVKQFWVFQTELSALIIR